MPPKPPSGIVSRWVRAVIGLFVGVAVGLAPYLGTQKVPLFESLLEMIPESIRDTTIPPAAICMGLIAVVIQWYGSERISAKTLRRGFLVTLAASIVSLFVFMWVQTTYVQHVSAAGGTIRSSFIVGTTRLPTCGCKPDEQNADCINGLSWNEAAIESCWGTRAIQQAGLIVRTSYLAATSAFAGLVGFLVLRGQRRKRF